MSSPKAVMLAVTVVLVAGMLVVVLACRLVEARQELRDVRAEAEALQKHVNSLRRIVRAAALQASSPQGGEGPKKPQEISTNTEGHDQILRPALGHYKAASDAGETEASIRGHYCREIAGPYLDLLQRVTRYVRAMGFQNITDEEIRDFCDLARNGGYDPRLWAVIAMAESSGGRGSSNLYGFMGGRGSPWSRPSGGWREQTAYLHDRITTFYSQYVDISQPSHVLFFHHEGDPVTYDPRSVFYVDNVMTWLERM